MLSSTLFLVPLMAVACSEQSRNILTPGASPSSSLTQSARTPCTTRSAGSPIIDGQLCPGEWTGATTFNFAANTPEGGTTPATLFVKNDGTNLYLAVRVHRKPSEDGGGQAVFEFDNDGDGVLGNGNDVFLYGSDGNFLDDFRTDCGSGPGQCSKFDTDDGGSNDGDGAHGNDGVFAVYELSHPLNSTDDAHDFSLTAGQTLGLSLQFYLSGSGGNAQTIVPGPGMFDYTFVTITP